VSSSYLRGEEKDHCLNFIDISAKGKKLANGLNRLLINKIE
jgi:hypothetical protein